MCKVNGKVANCSDVELCGDDEGGEAIDLSDGLDELLLETALTENEELRAMVDAEAKERAELHRLLSWSEQDVKELRRQQRQIEYGQRINSITEHLWLVLVGCNIEKEKARSISGAFVGAITSLMASYNNIESA